MATADWSTLTNIIADGLAVQGVTSGLPLMTGGSPNLWAFNSSTSTAAGGIARKYIGTAPLPVFDKGSIITGAMVRYTSVGTTGYSVYLFSCLDSDQNANDVTKVGYMLGLQDSDPCHIVLIKAAMSSGLPDGGVGDLGILRKSVLAVGLDEWLDLSLDCTVQASGDVRITCLRNANTDLALPADYQPIDGMDVFVDDVTKVNSGTDPLLAGPVGIGFRFSEPNRSAAVDHITISRQTTL